MVQPKQEVVQPTVFEMVVKTVVVFESARQKHFNRNISIKSNKYGQEDPCMLKFFAKVESCCIESRAIFWLLSS